MKTSSFKKYLTFLLLIGFGFTVQAQQEEYTEFLQQATKAIESGNQKEFTTNLKYFSVALERDNITPEILTEKNYKLYTRCLYDALVKQFKLSDGLALQALEFLYYEVENSPSNMFCLAYLYYHGYGVQQDFKETYKWLQKAADKGHDIAMHNLGRMYLLGQGVAQDYSQALYWFEKAIENGVEDAMLGLGYTYEIAPEGIRDYSKAMYWYEKATEKGNVGAMVNLGYLYQMGKGVNPDNTKAIFWYQKAAEKGNDIAMFNLASVFQSEQNYDQAKIWYQKACNKGNQGACKNYENIKNQ